MAASARGMIHPGVGMVTFAMPFRTAGVTWLQSTSCGSNGIRTKPSKSCRDRSSMS
ncbi:hypothetical protein [Arthrobacter sp. NA-172]|uniref:hypothetical protein n=1 Tax=Arthrobacter sp. NA-172 TaxID=3367524 RepID=UPI0037544814